ncbi:cuticle protein 7-like [Culicoides brevitarsis]|uniref:cuticle protein 7-like n=1 Tax=Culicoides brevitarsis TaxID=469753 RepID=UPI00307C39AB
MAFKYFALFALVAVAAAGIHELHLDEEHHAPAEYTFEYAVHDDHTGDIKSQKETRHGDQVEGHYTLIDADGHRRVVHYTADKHNGFQAKVEREYVGAHYEAPKHVKYVAPAPVHKVYESAPVYTKYEAAPVYTKVEAAPVYKSYGHHDDGHSHVVVKTHGAEYHY